MKKPVARVINLIEDEKQDIWNMTPTAARDLVRSVSTDSVGEDGAREDRLLGIEGSFALVARDGERVLMARSLDRPMRYFLAKEIAGPMLVVADRIDSIRAVLESEGYGEQFHPTYTRMVPAHHLTTLRLIGCPDPNPTHSRFFTPPRAVFPPDLDLIGERYIGALLAQIDGWLSAHDPTEPIGVLFSGGIDSGAVLVCLHHQLLARGESPARLKAFTLSIDGGGDDATQARDFLRRTNLEMLGETVAVDADAIDPFFAVGLIEDYKPLDVECATMAIAVLGSIRRRYPDWNLIVDGDGGDENLKDYPLEENSELTITSVVNNSMLYQEGWGVEAVKHSLTYTGGQSRGCVRTYAPASHFDFTGFSPFARPQVIEVAEAVPFAELSAGEPQELYKLKGEIVRRGVLQHTGVDMPIFPKRRFQHGAASGPVFRSRFSATPEDYRRQYLTSTAGSSSMPPA